MQNNFDLIISINFLFSESNLRPTINPFSNEKLQLAKSNDEKETVDSCAQPVATNTLTETSPTYNLETLDKTLNANQNYLDNIDCDFKSSYIEEMKTVDHQRIAEPKDTFDNHNILQYEKFEWRSKNITDDILNDFDLSQVNDLDFLSDNISLSQIVPSAGIQYDIFKTDAAETNVEKAVSTEDNTKILMDLAKNLSEGTGASLKNVKPSEMKHYTYEKSESIYSTDRSKSLKAKPKVLSVITTNFPEKIIGKKLSTKTSTITSKETVEKTNEDSQQTKITTFFETKQSTFGSSELETITPSISHADDPTYEPSVDISSLNQMPESNDDPSSIKISKVDDKPSFGKSKVGMIVPKSSSEDSKKYPCFFCGKLVVKIARHLEEVHKNEESVKEFSVLKPKSKQRQQIIKVLRNKGVNNYNKNSDSKVMITARRQRADKSRDGFAYISCENCEGTYLKSNIRHHKCVAVDPKNEKKIISRVVEGVKIECRMSEKVSQLLRTKVIHYMKDDVVTATAVYDESIVLYGNFLCDKYQISQLKRMVSARMKLLARVLLKSREYDPEITDFESLLHTKKYPVLEKAIYFISGYDEMKKNFEHPANVTFLATYVRQLSETVKVHHTIEQHDDQVRQIELFLSVFNQLYNAKSAKLVEEQNARNKRLKQDEELPLSEDIQKLLKFLKNTANKNVQKLQTEFDKVAFKQLVEVTAVHIEVFSKKRSGEIQKINIEDVENPRMIECPEVDLKTRKEAKVEMAHFVVRGKKNRTVSVIIRNEVLDWIKVILKHRSTAGVPENNRYLFGLPHPTETEHLVDICKAVSKFAKQCGAQKPELLGGTKLRKQFATQCRQLNLRDDQVQDLANFMGHHKDIHLAHYRKDGANAELQNFAPVLLQLERGKLASVSESGKRDTHKRTIRDDVTTLESSTGIILDNKNKKYSVI